VRCRVGSTWPTFCCSATVSQAGNHDNWIENGDHRPQGLVAARLAAAGWLPPQFSAQFSAAVQTTWRLAVFHRADTRVLSARGRIRRLVTIGLILTLQLKRVRDHQLRIARLPFITAWQAVDRAKALASQSGGGRKPLFLSFWGGLAFGIAGFGTAVE